MPSMPPLEDCLARPCTPMSFPGKPEQWKGLLCSWLGVQDAVVRVVKHPCVPRGPQQLPPNEPQKQ